MQSIKIQNLNFTMHFFYFQCISGGFLIYLMQMHDKLKMHRTLEEPGEERHYETNPVRTTIDAIETNIKFWFWWGIFLFSNAATVDLYYVNASQINDVENNRKSKKKTSFRNEDFTTATDAIEKILKYQSYNPFLIFSTTLV